MITGLVDRGAGPREIPGPVRALSSLPRPDYADLFTLATDVEAAPERWARAMFGHVPSPGELFIWRGLLGLRLTRERSPATVAGWQITGRGPDWVRLEAGSWFMTGNLLIQTADGQVALGTFLHYDRPLGRLWWPPLSAIHRRLVPGVLRQAAARLAAGSRSSPREVTGSPSGADPVTSPSGPEVGLTPPRIRG